MNYTPGTGQGQAGSATLIQNSASFTLSGISGGFDPAAAIKNVRFQWGTSLTETTSPGVIPGPLPAPEPSTLLGASMAGLVGLGYAWRRRKLVNA